MQKKKIEKLMEKEATNFRKKSLLRCGGGDEKNAGKNGAAHSHPARHPLRTLQMPSLCMRPDIGKVFLTS